MKGGVRGPSDAALDLASYERRMFNFGRIGRRESETPASTWKEAFRLKAKAMNRRPRRGKA